MVEKEVGIMKGSAKLVSNAEKQEVESQSKAWDVKPWQEEGEERGE